MTAVLVDTNVLVYAHDSTEPVKQERAIATLERLNTTGAGRLSAQCLAEFFSVVTRGHGPVLTLNEALRQLEALAHAWPTFDVTPLVVLEAARGVRDHQLSYWDAQLWATARLNQVGVIFSEDFRAGTALEGVRFVSPFARGFALDAWT